MKWVLPNSVRDPNVFPVASYCEEYERGQKWGRRERRIELREMGVEDSREDDGDTEEHVNVMNTNTGIKSNQENRLSINDICPFCLQFFVL